MLGVVGSGLKMVKFEPTTPNTAQQVATGWPNARNMMRLTMLRYVALACCDRLAGALDGFHYHAKKLNQEPLTVRSSSWALALSG